MDAVRIHARGGAKIWFLLGSLALIYGAIVATAQGAPGIGAVIALPGIGAIAWSAYGAKRHIDFGDAIVVQHAFRARTISWRDVKSYCIGEIRSSASSDAIRIPTTDTYLLIDLADYSRISLSVSPADFAEIASVLSHHGIPEVAPE